MSIRQRFLFVSLFLLLGATALQAQDALYATRNLTDQEMNVVHHDLDQEVLEEHSFLFTSKKLEGIAMIACTMAGDKGNKALQFQCKSPTSEGGYFPLPDATPTSWSLVELKAVSFGDFNGDGLGPDVISVAEYILPGTAQPSPVATVHFFKNLYTYTTDEKLNRHLYVNATRTVDQARKRTKTFLKK